MVVLASLDLGEPASPELAGGAALAASVFGSVGVLLALFWFLGSGDKPATGTNLMLAFVGRVAVAELGVLIGILGLLMTGSAVAMLLGLGLFLAALALLSLGLRRVAEGAD